LGCGRIKVALKKIMKMKKLIYLFGAFVGLSIAAVAQELPALKVGDQLNYLVDRGEQSYNFDITLTEVSNGISFTWIMSDPINKSGSITITANALKTATKYFNYFKSEDKVLEDQTCIFLSDANYNDLVSANKTSMDMGDGVMGVWSSTLDETLVTYKKNTTYQKAYFLKLENSTKEMTVLPIGNHHIIAKMNLHFTVTLVSIK
jgi:hypothetical protein